MGGSEVCLRQLPEGLSSRPEGGGLVLSRIASIRIGCLVSRRGGGVERSRAQIQTDGKQHPIAHSGTVWSRQRIVGRK